MIVLKTKTLTRGAYIYTITHLIDESGDISYLRDKLQEMVKLSDRFTQQERRELKQRIADYESGKWHIIAIKVEASIKPRGSSWPEPTVIGRAYFPGIESDAGDSFITRIEKDMIDEANQEVESLKDALGVCA